MKRTEIDSVLSKPETFGKAVLLFGLSSVLFLLLFILSFSTNILKLQPISSDSTDFHPISESPSRILSCTKNNVEVIDISSVAVDRNAPVIQNDPRIPPISNRSDHLLGVIIPYRNRWIQLLALNLLLGKFLRKQGVKYRMFAINQSDSYRFNRGSLMNTGVHIAMKYGCDYVALQDADLIPVHDSLSYGYPKEGVYHVSPKDLHVLYARAPDFFGGIAVVRVSSYLKMNGFSNLFWGWGKEDEDFLRRFNAHASSRFTRQRPPRRAESGAENEIYFYHFHGDEIPRDKRTLSRGTPNAHLSGYTDLEFECKRMYILDEPELGIKDLIIVDVELTCNFTKSPNCDDEYAEALVQKQPAEAQSAKQILN